MLSPLVCMIKKLEGGWIRAILSICTVPFPLTQKLSKMLETRSFTSPFQAKSRQWQGGLLCVVKAICGHIPNLEFVNCGKIPIHLRINSLGYHVLMYSLVSLVPGPIKCMKLWWVTRLWYGSMTFQFCKLFFQSFNAVSYQHKSLPRCSKGQDSSTPPFQAKLWIWIDGFLLLIFLKAILTWLATLLYTLTYV